ncbi:MAG: hypothetical protein P8130_08765 [Deltaproteobacteria bacterium]
MQQYVLTTAGSKRLIGKGMASHPAILAALESGTIVIVAGTTNGYVAEEVLTRIGQAAGFEKKRFFRGITLPPSGSGTGSGGPPKEGQFPGDVVISRGQWQKGMTIFDVVDDLREGDVIVKGANALDVARRRAAILIGDPKGGTIGAAIQAVVGRRVRLILPVGLEKRVVEDLDTLAAKLNAPGAHGPRLWPVPGEVFIEQDAITLLSGANAELIAAGGVGGAEGCIRIAVGGDNEQQDAAASLIRTVRSEPAFEKN